MLRHDLSRLRTYLAAALSQIEQYKRALKRLADANTELEQALKRRNKENKQM